MVDKTAFYLEGHDPNSIASLRSNWTLAATCNDWRLADATDAFYSSGCVVARDPRGLAGTHIGTEYDLETSYRINRTGVRRGFWADFSGRVPGPHESQSRLHLSVHHVELQLFLGRVRHEKI